jgi:hypothetical protein
MSERTCHHCLYARWMRPGGFAAVMGHWTSRLICVNSVSSPGQLCEVAPTGMCRNFKARPKPTVRTTVPEPPDEHVRYIPLTKGKYATVDAADYEWLSGFRWHATECRGRFYAATVINGKSISMHRLIMNPPAGMLVDHIDGQSLNNRRTNLRLCNRQQNRHNTRPGKNSRFIGVFRRRDKWFAKVTRDRKCHFLGPFETEIEAAKARDEKAKELFGEFAWLNFPDASP